MQIDRGDLRLGQLQNAAALIARVVDGPGRVKIQRVVRHDTLRADRLCLVDHVRHRVERDKDGIDRRVEPAAEQADVVPVHFHGRGRKGKQGVIKITNSRHGASSFL